MLCGLSAKRGEQPLYQGQLAGEVKTASPPSGRERRSGGAVGILATFSAFQSSVEDLSTCRLRQSASLGQVPRWALL